MNRKGFAIHWIVLPLAFFASLGAFLYYYSLNPDPISGDYLGDFQLNLVKNFQRGEKALFYIDKSANYSAHQAAYNLARQGGIFEPSCEPYYGSNIWIGKGKDGLLDCEPEQEDIENYFAQSFEKELTEFLAFYPDVLIPAYYDYNIQDYLEITAVSREDIVFDILPEKPAPRLTKPLQPRGIYTDALQNVPEKLRVAMKSEIDIQTIQEEHYEVLVQYAELCKRIGIEKPPGVCTSAEQKCCITSGYRHPSKNEATKGAASNSAHLYGLAIDISAATKQEQLKLVRANEGNSKELPKLFTRVAIYPDSTHVHFDLMPLKGEYNAPYLILSKNTGKTLAIASSISELEGKAKPFGFG